MSERFDRWAYRNPEWFYTAPLAVWVILIAAGSLAPPSHLPKVDVANIDKVWHALVYLVFGALLLRGWVREGPIRPGGVALIVTIATVWGLYLEMFQTLTPMRTFDWRDVVANGLGAIVGVVAWWTIKDKLQRTKGK